MVWASPMLVWMVMPFSWSQVIRLSSWSRLGLCFSTTIMVRFLLNTMWGSGPGMKKDPQPVRLRVVMH